MHSKIWVSSPGKIILHGEHAVVYGKLAIASSLNLRTHITLIPTINDYTTVDISKSKISFRFSNSYLQKIELQYGQIADFWLGISRFCLENVTINGKNSAFEQSSSVTKLTIQTFLYLYYFLVLKGLGSELSEHSMDNGLQFNVISQIPIGAGLGSSASYCVSLATVLLIYTKQIPQKSLDYNLQHLELINKWSYEAETLIHGTPSGLDNSTSTYGGLISMHTGKMDVLESHKKDLYNMTVLCINTLKTRNTKDLINIVRTRQNLFPGVIDSLLDAIEKVTQQSFKLLGLSPKDYTITSNCPTPNGDLKYEDQIDFSNLGVLMDMNHDLLNALGVGHAVIEDVRNIVKKHSHNALYPKMTGAGGGGCLFALIPNSLEPDIVDKVRNAVHETGYETYLTQICCPGVQTHHEAIDQ